MKKTLLLYLIASTPIYSATTIIKQNFQLPTKTFQSHKGSCFASSIASTRSDAYRCMVGNQIIDPCFTVKKQGYVVCNANQLPPTFQYVIKLDKPLAKNTNQNIKIKDQQPWLIQLKNGQYCTPFTGTRPFIDGKVLTYSCEIGRAHV